MSDAFLQNGVGYHFTDKTTSQFYGQIAPLLTSFSVRLLDSERLTRQMLALRRRLGSQGQEQVTHPGKAHDDLATSATVALVLVRQRAAPETIEEEEAQRPDGSFELPAREAGSRYEALVLVRYGEARAASIVHNAKLLSEGDPEAYAECFLDTLPGLARIERGRRAAGH